MKKKFLTLLVTLALILLFIISIKLGDKYEKQKEEEPLYCQGNSGWADIDFASGEIKQDGYFFELKYTDENTTEPLNLYYTDNEERDYYLFCLDEIILNYEKESITLKEALEKEKTNLNDLLRRFSEKNVFLDGGTTHYSDKALYSIWGVSLIKCNTINENNDIYIGPMYMNYEDMFCKDYLAP